MAHLQHSQLQSVQNSRPYHWQLPHLGSLPEQHVDSAAACCLIPVGRPLQGP